MKFILIRHSKTDRNPFVPITQWGLSDEGVGIAKELSQNITIQNLDILYASLQTKALETAVLLAKPNATPIKTDDRLTEVTSFTGLYEPNFDVYTKNVHDFYDGTIERIGDGETKAEALDRFMTALKAIAKTETGSETVGVVTHGNILSLFAAEYKAVDPYELHTQIKQPDAAIFDWDKKQFDRFFGEL